ncbi:TfuA-like protein [Microbispora sitophila]|uniref:TfuA-like protein n=1 Tax=Microbispora sitophila TaxID=2771537 RepID=UPI00186658EE|nr:TfuA domain-containing protein [Microbispora sitophila]
MAAGDLLRLGARVGDVVGIVDGYFHQRAAVRHKEILALLSAGVAVHGAASMGALRAAELASFGMVGHGRIFADYCRGIIEADDEVAMLHGSEAEDYQPFTEALVNVRYALDGAVGAGLITAPVAHAVLTAARRLPFAERTRDRIVAAAHRVGDADERRSVEQAIRSAADVKHADARLLLDAVCGGSPQNARPAYVPHWRLNETAYLRAWQAGVGECGSLPAGEGEEGRLVSAAQAHTACRVLALDYPAFRERVATWTLARDHATAIAPGEAASAGDSALMRVLRAGLGLREASEEEVLRQAVLARLRALGLVAPEAYADPGLDRWCTTSERSMPEAVRTVKAASRALFTDLLLGFHDPFMDALRSSGAYRVARSRVAQSLLLVQRLREERPSLHLSQLRPGNVLAWFSQQWGRVDMDDAVLERGFSTTEDFVACARPYYLFHKANPHLRPLTIG